MGIFCFREGEGSNEREIGRQRRNRSVPLKYEIGLEILGPVDVHLSSIIVAASEMKAVKL